MTAPGLPAGPYKPYDPTKVGDQVQNNYEFMKEIFGPGQAQYRQQLLAMSDNDLRTELAEYGLVIPQGVRIVLVDLETAKMHHNGGPIDLTPGTGDTFYQLVMPPVPRRHPNSSEYRHDQQWEDAWYHAIVDSYGM
jgi:hypothetical protein